MGVLGFMSLRSSYELLAATLVVVAGWVLSRRNCAGEKRREQQLERLLSERIQAISAEKDRAREISRLKSQYVSNISHEIRTPMNGILGGLDLAIQNEPTAEQRGYLELSKASAVSLMSVLEDILEFFRTELDDETIQRVSFPLGRCIDGVISMMTPLANRKSLTVRTEIAKDLPERVVGDPARLHEALLRLIDNAVKFSSRGEVLVSVQRQANGETNSVHDTTRLLFCIEDHGIGIPPDKRHAIFEPFRQLEDGLARNSGGVGLGLTITKRLVRLMGGRIWAESELGQGSRFYFTANFQHAMQTSAQKPWIAGPIETLERMETRPQVLLVEDNKVNQLLVSRLLEKRGYHCLVAGNGWEALSILAATSVNLVLMDLQMPEMDGYEATRCIRELDKQRGTHIPILAMTTHSASAEREACLVAGMDGFIAKPVQSNQLFARIDALLEKRTVATEKSGAARLAHSTERGSTIRLPD